MFKRIKHLAAVAAALGAVVAASGSASAQEMDRLQIHGFLTQGVGVSSDEQYLGITKIPTYDYRNAALQFSYALTNTGTAVLQVSHRRLGKNVITASENEVNMDWAFYRQRLGPVTAKVGRVPVPAGIYNEIRDVGTLLPFYRAPAAFYAEGFETMDGAVVSAEQTVGGGWGVQVEGFTGSYQVATPSYGPDRAPSLLRTGADRLFGGHVWLNTPIQGVRVGGGGRTFHRQNADKWDLAKQVSLDATFSRGYLRAEAKRTRVATNTTDILYAQLGGRVVGGLSANVQMEHSRVTSRPVNAPEFEYDALRDLAASLNYAVNPGLIFKVEGHQTRGTTFDRYVLPTGPSAKTTYGLASVAVSF